MTLRYIIAQIDREILMNQKKIPTVYLVDSENVNDVWIRLVTNMDAEDEILVFYTEKSPHMSYEKVIELTQLSDRPIQWIKCVEGSNALDFQLVVAIVGDVDAYRFLTHCLLPPNLHKRSPVARRAAQ